jgi:hypothetical protein
MMRRSMAGGFVALLFGVTFGVVVPVAAPAGAQTVPWGTRSIPAAGTTNIRSVPFGAEGLVQPELRHRRQEQEGPASAMAAVEAVGQAGEFGRRHPFFDRDPFPDEPLAAPAVRSSVVRGSDAAVSVAGLNHRDQRLANNGNQFSLEPPDQALCAGNGFVVESTNSVLRVHDRSGAALTGVQDLNTFLGYPAAIDRTTGVIGAQVIDPVCHYDPDFKRFVVAVTTLHVLPDGQFTGKNTIDVAVSNTGDPTGAWTVYRIPAQNDGTDGTPDHGCTIDGTVPGPCFQDYPHIGGDRNGIYISTNEYDLFGPSYSAAQLYALSKQELAAHGPSVRVTLVENLSVAGTPGFTVWPATSPKGEYASARNGTEYFLSTIAGDGSETGNPTGTARKIGVWALTNTRSLDSATPNLGMASRLINSATYVFPPLSDQKAGDFPLGQCVNDTTITTPFGPGCWQLLFVDEPAHDEVISTPDSLDTRMQQTWFVNGELWGSAGTAVRVGGETRAGIVWFKVRPFVAGSSVFGAVERQGYLALANNNLSMPAIAVTPRGEGAIAFSIMGEDRHPTAAYVRIDDRGRVGPIRIAAEGVGVDDGFTSYRAFNADPTAPPRTRWGDYGAAVTDGNDIWIASEYIAQTCTLTEWLTGSIGSCGGTRTALGNWATRLTKLST